jgi:hypothetical protein
MVNTWSAMNDDTAVDTKSSVIETGWKSTPTLSELKENYDDAQLEHTTQQAKIDEWVAYLNVTGIAKIAKVTGRSNVQPKLIRKQAEWRYPTLTEPFLSTDDVFNVYPITAEDVKSAQQNQLVLNNQFNTKIKKVKFIDDYVRSAVDEGTVIVRVGWISEEATIEEEVPVYEYSPDMTGDGLKRYSALMALQQSNPKKYKEFTNPGVEQGIKTLLETGQVLIPTQVGTETQERIIEIKNHPTVTVCDSKNIIIDPSCEGDISKAGFIIFNFETSKSALRKAGKYSNIDSINIEGSSPLNDPDYTGGKDNANFNFKDEPRTKFWASEYWGFWDIHGTGTVEPIVVTWAGTTIIQMEVSPFPDKELPFVFASLMPVRRSAYGEPDGELLRDNQQIIGAVSRGMIDLMGKSAAGQTGMRKDFLDVTNARKFREGKDYEYNANTDPRLGVFQHTYPEIPQSAYNMLNIQNAEAESFSGVKAFSAGITGQALGDVAAGVRGALDAASKRELGILRRLAAGVVEIGRKIISLNAQFLSEEEVVRITDEEFVTIRRDDLAGNFDLKLTISTAEEDDQKAKELVFMLQTMGNNADPDITRMLLTNIARLRKMPDLARALENFKPQPNPLAEMKAQLEIKLLEAQIAKEQALAQQHGSNANLTTAQVAGEQAATLLDFTKVDTEKAKARNLLSDADNKDLNYVEQESGVEQERNLEKIRGQAEAQAKTKVIEAMLKPQPAKAKVGIGG